MPFLIPVLTSTITSMITALCTQKVIEKTSSLISSFKPVMKVPICGNCGLKDEKLADKCPVCKSPFII